MKLSRILIITAVVGAMLAGCKKDDPTFTVKFDSRGGSAVAEKIVKKGDKVPKPPDPTLANNGFAGWETAANALWNFDTGVTADMTLFARWNINTYTVTFDPDNGSAVTTQTVEHGKTATAPTNPAKAFTPAAGVGL